jgi:hypothetical protein
MRKGATSLNSKQVVNDVLSHRQPAYIPLGTYAIDCDTVEKIVGHETYVRNKVKTFIALMEGRRDEVLQSLKEDSVALFRKLDCIDIILPEKEAILLPPIGCEPEKYRKLCENCWQDEQGNIYRASESTNDITLVKHGGHLPSIKDYEGEPELAPPDESIFEAYDHLAGEFASGRFIMGMSGGFDIFPLPGGMENGLAFYALDHGMIQAAIHRSLTTANYFDRFFIRKGADQVMVGSDFSTTTGLLISPTMFSDICFPAMRDRVANIKKYRDKVILHSCGNTWKALDMIVESGVDCYQSMQTGAGMDIRLLKEKYGRKLAFWGGVGVEKLIGGTPEDVLSDVRYAMKYGSPEGGFILGPSHSIAYGTKYENFMAMLDEHDKLKYKYS